MYDDYIKKITKRGKKNALEASEKHNRSGACRVALQNNPPQLEVANVREGLEELEGSLPSLIAVLFSRVAVIISMKN